MEIHRVNCYNISMSLTKPIPPEMREEMSQDKFYSKCCIADEHCGGVIQWHHNLQFRGSRVNEIFCILPVCKKMHDKADTNEIRERLDHVMWNRATNEQITFYSKANDYKQRKEYLNNKYGIYTQR